MSDRIAVLCDGRLMQIGSPEQLYNNPADSFVASFIGESTLLPVKRAGDNEVRLGEVTLRSARPLPSGNELQLALQTEKLLLGDGTAGTSANRIPCRVTEIVYQGESLRSSPRWRTAPASASANPATTRPACGFLRQANR